MRSPFATSFLVGFGRTKLRAACIAVALIGLSVTGWLGGNQTPATVSADAPQYAAALGDTPWRLLGTAYAGDAEESTVASHTEGVKDTQIEANQAARSWMVVSTTGNVWTLASEAGERQPVAAGATLLEPTWIEVGPDGWALLAHGKSRATVRANSKLQVVALDDAGKSTRLRQTRGLVYFDVEKQPNEHFLVETPYLIAGVKGTRFSVDVSAQAATVSVSSGQVSVSSAAGGAAVSVSAGESASSSSASAASVSVSSTADGNGNAAADGNGNGNAGNATGNGNAGNAAGDGNGNGNGNGNAGGNGNGNAGGNGNGNGPNGGAGGGGGGR